MTTYSEPALERLRVTVFLRAVEANTADGRLGDLYLGLRAKYGTAVAVRATKAAEMLRAGFSRVEAASHLGVGLRTIEGDLALLRAERDAERERVAA